jgi:hypothetical protein
VVSCRRPALQLNNFKLPSGNIKLPSGSITARLLPIPADNAIDVRKLGPDRNSRRAVSTCSAEVGPQLLPTPLYNTSILQVFCCPSAFPGIYCCGVGILVQFWLRNQAQLCSAGCVFAEL